MHKSHVVGALCITVMQSILLISHVGSAVYMYNSHAGYALPMTIMWKSITCGNHVTSALHMTIMCWCISHDNHVGCALYMTVMWLGYYA